MAMISKQAKQPMEGKSASVAPSAAAIGGSQRTSFQGSSDGRSAGNPAGNVGPGMKKGNGYYNEGAPNTMGGFRTGDNKPGARGAMTKGARTASEDVTKGMGGKVIKDMR